jgi:hypothetical protein
VQDGCKNEIEDARACAGILWDVPLTCELLVGAGGFEPPTSCV